MMFRHTIPATVLVVLLLGVLSSCNRDQDQTTPRAEAPGPEYRPRLPVDQKYGTT
jgi:hypothetical protein